MPSRDTFCVIALWAALLLQLFAAAFPSTYVTIRQHDLLQILAHHAMKTQEHVR